MPYPDLYGVTYSYTGFQQAQGDNSFPGTQIDADFAGLQSSIFGVAAFVERGFRSDGALANGSVGYDQLSPSLQLAGISAASAWLTGTAYAVGAGVVQSQKLYRGLVAHTSGVFATDLAAGKWIFVANIGDLSTTGTSVAGHLPVFSDATAKLMVDSGVALSSLATTAALAGLAPLVSPAFTTPNIGVATGTSLALSPTPSTIAQGLSVTQTLPAGAGSAGVSYSANLISIVDNGYESPEGFTGDATFGLLGATSGFRVNYQSKGRGTPNIPIFIGATFATAATGAGQQLVGMNATVYSNVNSAGNDSYWAIIGYLNIGASANLANVFGVDAEVSIAAGATVAHRIGVQASSLGPGLGTTIDAAFAVTASAGVVGATAPWTNGLVLWKSDGVTNPIGISGSVIISADTFTAGNFAKFPNVTFSNFIFDFGATKFQTDGSGNTIMGGGSLTLGVAGTNVGKTLFKNATSGTLTVQPPTGALGAVTNTLQAVNDTFVYRATADTLTNKTISSAVSVAVGQAAPVSGTLAVLSNNAFARPAFSGNTPILDVVAGSNSKPSVALYNFDQAGAGVGVQPTIYYLASRGTASAQVAVASGDFLGANFAYGYNSNLGGYATGAGAGFIVEATEAYTGANSGARFSFYATPTGTAGTTRAASIGAALMVGTTVDGSAGQIIMNNAAFLMRNKTAWSSGAAAAAGTLTNAPAAGNPTKWVPIDDNGTTRYIPAW